MSGKLIITSDGSHTLEVPGMDEHYHSTAGAVQESMIVFISNGFDYSSAEKLNILEIGFGTGLNVLLTLMRSVETGRTVAYTSVEYHPLPLDILLDLNHFRYAGNEGRTLADLVYRSEWNKEVCLTENFSLKKIKTDFTLGDFGNGYNLIFFDAFGPDKQPEMWSQSLFMKLSDACVPGAILVTYSVKGTVKRALKASGFLIELLKGPPGKRQVLRAVKL